MKKVLPFIIFLAPLSPLCSIFAQTETSPRESRASDTKRSDADRRFKAQETASANPGQGARDLAAADGTRVGNDSSASASKAAEAKKYYESGAALVEAGKFDEAIEKLRQAVKLDPGDAQAQYSLGLAYSKANKYDEAAESFKRAARIKPEWGEAHFRLGWVYYVLDKKNQARAEHKKLLNLNSALASTLWRIIKDQTKAASSPRDTNEVASNGQPPSARPDDTKKEENAPGPRPKQEQSNSRGLNSAASDRLPNPAVMENQNQASGKRGEGATTNGDGTISPPSAPSESIIKAGSPISPPTTSAEAALVNTYRVGVGDVLDIRILDSATKTSTLYTVIDGGVIEFPLVGGSMAVAGLTTDEIQTRLAAELKRRAVQETGPVSIGVRQYTSHAIVITGLVAAPGGKTLRREAVPLYVLLAEAQPRLDAARVTIMRADGASFTVDLADQSSLNVLIRPGDIINVATRPQEFYYIGGRVSYPGQKNHQAGITLLQAILAAGGLVRASDNAVEISREGADGRLATTKYSLKDIKAGKTPDPRLQPGDRIEVVR